MKLEYKTFIFNWVGQEKNVLLKIKQFNNIGYNPIIINSDGSLIHKYPNWIHIGEQSYFTQQFNSAVKLFDAADIMFHIQADASYSLWDSLIKDASKYYNKHKYGIYAPNINYTGWMAGQVNIRLIEDKLWEVKNTDCTCWFIHKDIINKYENIDISKNKFGWGIDLYLVHISKLQNRIVLRDYNHTISHPQGTNYDRLLARQELEYMKEKIKSYKL